MVTSKKYKDLIHSELPEIPDDNILYEPSATKYPSCYLLPLLKIKYQR